MKMKFLSKLSKSEQIKKVLLYCIVIFSCLYIFSIPSFGESSSFTRYIIYIAMIMLGLSVFSYLLLYGDFRLRKEALLIPLFALIALLGTVIYSKEFRAWFSLVLLSISFFIFIYAFKIIKSKIVILNIITIALFLFSLYFIYYFRSKIIHFNSETRLGPPFDNQNGVAAFAVVGFSVPLYLLFFYSRKIRFIYLIPILTSLVVGIATGSRTFYAVVIIFLLVFLFFKFQKHKILYLCVVGVLIGFSILFINLPFMESFKLRIIASLETIFGTASKVDTSTLERVVYVDYGFVLGSKNLIIGYGVNGFSIFSGVGTYAHSNFAEVLCDFGIIGFIVFYLPLLILFFKAITNKKIDKVFVVSFFAYYLIVSITNVLYYKKIYFLILAFLFYLVYFDPSLRQEVPLVKDIKKLVFTCDSMDAGGAEKVIATISNQMAKNNISVTIIGVSSTDSVNSFYNLNDGVTYITLANGSHKRIGSLKRVFLLRKVIKGIEPDAVISFLPHINVYTSLSLMFTKIPHIVSERNNPYINPTNKLLRLLKKISFNLADGCVFQTQEAMDYYSYKLAKKSIIIKNPIELSFVPSNGVIERNKTVLAVGRLDVQKNYKCLLDAFKLFNDNKSKEYTLKVYGSGLLKDELLIYCKTIGIVSNVVFLGTDLKWHSKEYNDAMYILSSDYEGSSNSLAEAMALGIPSISTDCPIGGSRELIQDGINGYLVPVNDPIALANKMIKLSEQSPNIFYDSTRSLIVNYSPEATFVKWMDYLRQLKKEVYE